MPWLHTTKKSSKYFFKFSMQYIFIGFYLWSGSKINDSIQFKALAKLVIHPVMPVLINCPLSFIHAFRFIQIRCKNIPKRESSSTHVSFQKKKQTNKEIKKKTWTRNILLNPVAHSAMESRKRQESFHHVFGQWFSKYGVRTPWVPKIF